MMRLLPVVSGLFLGSAFTLDRESHTNRHFLANEAAANEDDNKGSVDQFADESAEVRKLLEDLAQEMLSPEKHVEGEAPLHQRLKTISGKWIVHGR